MGTAELRQRRVKLAGQLPWVLEGKQGVGIRDIGTGGKSLFLQYYDHRQILCVSAEEVPTRVVHAIAAQKNHAQSVREHQRRYLHELVPTRGEVQQWRLP
jgi:hypothetical protein